MSSYGALTTFYSGDYSVAAKFFKNEYDLDLRIAELCRETSRAKCIALLEGICMGGGVGLSIGASRRVRNVPRPSSYSIQAK